MIQKIYCFNNGGPSDWLQAVAICEDGHVLAQHICSDVGYMQHDLSGNWKHENYNKHCGEGKWVLEWVDDPKTHEGLISALAKNRALPRDTA